MGLVFVACWYAYYLMQRLTIHDTNVVSLTDLSSQFFVRESDISTNRFV